jgi:indole-3-glycerol phosphate synthase
VLERLFAQAKEDASLREQAVTKTDLLTAISALQAPPDVYEALKPSSNIKLIAEIKRASPSKGFLAEIPNAAELATGYENSGAHAVSVLTESSGFGGNLDDLRAVAREVQLPVLRKDFISNEYQILEARAAGASFILLILSYLEVSQARDLMSIASSLDLGVLVETHSRDEVDSAAALGARLIGINTRNLKTFETDPALFEELAEALPSDVIKVAESSVKTLADVRRYRDSGADVVLVGEALVTGDWKKFIPEIVSVS